MKQKYIAGDKVRCIGTYKGPIVEIDEVRCDECILEYHNGAMYHANYSEIEPIPLTVEILEKNGWRLRKHNKGQNYDDVEYFEYHNPSLVSIQLRYYVEEKEFYPFCYNNEIEVKGGNAIKWVHQLQHLFFGLGFNSEIKM